MNLEKIRAHIALNEELKCLLTIIDHLSEIPELISDAQDEGVWDPDPDTSYAIVEHVRSYIADVFLGAS